MLGDVLEVDYGYEDRLITRLDLRAIVAKSLSDRERRILHSRIHGSTLQEIGDSDGVSRERVRQIYDKAIRRLQWKATRKKQVPKPTKPFMHPTRERIPPVIPQVIPSFVVWTPPPDRSPWSHVGPVVPPQPIPWSPGDLERDRIIISVYWTPGGLIRRHHTESGAYAADMRDMMKIGDRIEVLADGVCTKLALRGDKWRLVDV